MFDSAVQDWRILFPAAALALTLMGLHLLSLGLAWPSCRPAPRFTPPPDAPSLTVARVLCGVEATSETALATTLAQSHPDLRVIFCVAHGDDPVIRLAKAAMAAHPQVDARILVGEDPVSANPKLNNMVKAWREATTDQVLFLDSNLMTPPDYAARVQASWKARAGLVSAPPIGDLPGDFAAEIEAAFLNTHAARWQYAAGAAGLGFAQGKTLLFSRAAMPLGDLSPLGELPAEDAAATRLARANGRCVALAAPPAAQWLGRRRFVDVWRRQLRWARLRRATFPALYVFEAASGATVPLASAMICANAVDAPWLAAGYALLWWGAEWSFALAAGWPAGMRGALALVARDALLPILWVAGLFGGAIAWNGRAIPLAGDRRAQAAFVAGREGARPGGATARIRAVWRKALRPSRAPNS